MGYWDLSVVEDWLSENNHLYSHDNDVDDLDNHPQQ